MFREIRALYNRKMMNTLRQPVWIAMSLATPLLYMLLFAPLLMGLSDEPQTMVQVLDGFVPAILTLLAFGAGMGGGWDNIFDLQMGIIERFRVTSARRFSLMFGGVLHDITMFLVPALLVLVIALFFGFTANFFGIIILLLLLCMLTALFSAWSSSMALILKELNSFAAVANAMQLPLTLLSGVLLPMSLGPQWLYILAHINPLFYTVEASRALSVGTFFTLEVYLAFAVIVPLTVLMLLWARRVYRRAIK